MSPNFDWATFQELAEDYLHRALALDTKSAMREALLRSAISRAYYAIFILARNHLRDNDNHLNIPDYGTVHSYVVNQFLNSGEGQRRFIGRILRGLRGLRNKADYDDNFPDLLGRTQRAIAEANQVIKILAGL